MGWEFLNFETTWKTLALEMVHQKESRVSRSSCGLVTPRVSRVMVGCGLVTPRVSRVMVGLVVGLQPLVEPSRLGRGSSQQCGPRDAGEAGGVHVWRRPKGGVLGSIATAF